METANTYDPQIECETPAQPEPEAPVKDSLQLSSPWAAYAHALAALFAQDQHVQVRYMDDAGSPVVKVFVEGALKAEAIGKLLPSGIQFGNVNLRIVVLPANDDDGIVDLFATAFAGNQALLHIQSVTRAAATVHYVTFAREVVQYFNDNLSSPAGVTSTLYEDIAREVLDAPGGVFFTTELPGDLKIPENPGKT